jgi:hypothetical protein
MRWTKAVMGGLDASDPPFFAPFAPARFRGGWSSPTSGGAFVAGGDPCACALRFFAGIFRGGIVVSTRRAAAAAARDECATTTRLPRDYDIHYSSVLGKKPER